MDDALPTDALPRLLLLAKPSGPTCNDITFEIYLRRLLESHRAPTMTVVSQSGGPALMKLESVRRSVELVE